MKSAIRLIGMTWLSMTSAFCFAAALTDSTVGPVQPLSGQFEIPESLGQRTAGNLFHCFKSLSLDKSKNAAFTFSLNLSSCPSFFTLKAKYYTFV